MKNLNVVLLLALLGLTPALAAEDSSWFLGIDVMGSRPTNVPNVWVLQDPNTNGIPQGQLLSLDSPYGLSGRISFGQSYGDDEGGWFVAYTRLSSDESETATSGAGFLWDILYNANQADDSFAGSASAEIETESTLGDIGYFHPIHTGERVRSTWNVALRYGTLDYDLDVDYTGEGETVQNQSETSGIGLRVGLDAHFKLGGRVWLGGGTAFSYLSGDTKSSSYQQDTGVVSLDVSRKVDQSISILEAFVDVNVDLTDWIWLRFAYEFQQWNNALNIPTFPDDVSDAFLTDQTSDVNWDSLAIGIGFRFGGGKS